MPAPISKAPSNKAFCPTCERANTVNAAKNDPKTEWHSSWHGNFVVNTFGGDHKGLCWEWRNLVYDAVAPTARRVGWDACGVNINYGTVFEHHNLIRVPYGAQAM